MDAHLADEFDRVSRDLERHARHSKLGHLLAFMKKHRVLSTHWEVVQQIRQIDGFTNFLQALPFSSLQFQLAASEGPVIIVKIAQVPSSSSLVPVLVPLPNASPEALRELSQGLSSALALEHDRDKLCGLLLHAAGPYKPGRKNLPDLYISSYTPTLSSLIRARSHVVPRLTAPKVLAMDQPNDNTEMSKLPQVREDLRRTESMGDFVDALIGDEATRDTFLARLQQYQWVHFTCHGHLAPREPSFSSFQLHDNERLTLGDFIKARLSNAEFAFLSARHTPSINVDNMPDEAIHLAAALQFCGFRSVVGTLWTMADADGPYIAEDFYGSVGDFRDAAVVHTRDMRKRGVPIDRWINFIHIGA